MWSAVSDAAGTATGGTGTVPGTIHVTAAPADSGAHTRQAVLPVGPPLDVSSQRALATREASGPTLSSALLPHEVPQGPGTIAQMGPSLGGPPVGLAVSQADPAAGAAFMHLQAAAPQSPPVGSDQAVHNRMEAVRRAEGGAGAAGLGLERPREDATNAAGDQVHGGGAGPGLAGGGGASRIPHDTGSGGESLEGREGGLSKPGGTGTAAGLLSGHSRGTDEAEAVAERGSGRAGVPSWRDADSEDSEPLPEIASGSSSSEEDESDDESEDDEER